MTSETPSPASANDLRLIATCYRATNAIVRELDARLSRGHGVTFIQAVTLLAIDSCDSPQPHVIADRLQQQSQTVTGVLDRIERAGWVTRLRDLRDRRAVRLELTDRGRDVVAKVRETLEKDIHDVLCAIDMERCRRLEADLGKLESVVARKTARTGAETKAMDRAEPGPPNEATLPKR